MTLFVELVKLVVIFVMFAVCMPLLLAMRFALLALVWVAHQAKAIVVGGRSPWATPQPASNGWPSSC